VNTDEHNLLLNAASKKAHDRKVRNWKVSENSEFRKEARSESFGKFAWSESSNSQWKSQKNGLITDLI